MDRRIGRYELLEDLAAGGQATVYRARDTSSNQVVALKVLHPHLARDRAYVDRFLREARMAASFDHPNIVRAFDAGEADGTAFIAMELLPTSLGARLKEHAPLPPDEAVYIAHQVALALDHAHARGVTHRDIKPQNILLTSSGTVKVTDFGIARASDEMSLTQTGMLMGTPQYMAPEQVQGHAVDHRADIYSLGIVLFEMLTGSPPFQGETPWEVLRQHDEASVPDLRSIGVGVAPEVEGILQRALAKDPAERFQTAGELAQAILATLARPARRGPAGGADSVTEPFSARQAHVPRRSLSAVPARPAERPVTRSKRPAALIGLLLLATTAAALILLRSLQAQEGSVDVARATLDQGQDRTAAAAVPLPVPGFTGSGRVASRIIFDGESLWVANPIGDTVTKLNLAGLTLGTYAVGRSPTEMATDGRGIWVLNSGDDTVTRLAFDGTSMGTSRTLAGADSLSTLAFDGQNMWVTHPANDSITRLGTPGTDTKTTRVRTPVGIAFDGTRLWVANLASDRLSRLSLDGEVLGTYPVGKNPQRVLVAGDSVWVTNRAHNMVSRVSIDGSESASYQVGEDPSDLVFDGKRVWVAIRGEDSVAVLGLDGTTLGKYRVGRHPEGLASDGRNIWVTSWDENSVTKLSTDGAPLGTFLIGHIPLGIAFDGKDVWVASTNTNSVFKLSQDGARLGEYSAGQYPYAVLFDGRDIWATNPVSDSVTRLSLDGSNLGSYRVGSRPFGMAFDGRSLWVANAGDGTLTSLNPDATIRGTYAVGGRPLDILFDGTHIWVAFFEGNTLARLTLDGEVTGVYPVGAPGERFEKLVFDGRHLWAASSELDRLVKLNQQGQIVGRFEVGRQPWDLAFDGEHVWVANFGNDTVFRSDVDGAVVATYKVGKRPWKVVLAGRYAWVANVGDDTLTRIDRQGDDVRNYSVRGNSSDDADHSAILLDPGLLVQEVEGFCPFRNGIISHAGAEFAFYDNVKGIGGLGAVNAQAEYEKVQWAVRAIPRLTETQDKIAGQLLDGSNMVAQSLLGIGKDFDSLVLFQKGSERIKAAREMFIEMVASLGNPQCSDTP